MVSAAQWESDTVREGVNVKQDNQGCDYNNSFQQFGPLGEREGTKELLLVFQYIFKIWDRPEHMPVVIKMSQQEEMLKIQGEVEN